jgi:hypothetical protein
MSELNTAEASDESSFSLRTKLFVAAILFLLIGGIIYSSYSYIKNAPLREFDAAVAGVDIEKIADMEAEERKAFFETMKTIRDKMSDAQKKINDEKNMLRMNEQFKEKFNRFFGSSPEEQRAALDKDIDRMAGMMKGFMSGKGGFGPPGAGGPGGGGGFKPADNSAKKTATPPNGANTANANGAGGANTSNGTNTANANGAGGANTNGAGGPNTNGAGGANTANANGAGGPNVKGKGGPTPEERNKRLSDGLDKSTPEMRAQMTEYWVRMNQRIKERGVQMIPFLGGFGGPKPK